MDKPKQSSTDLVIYVDEEERSRDQIYRNKKYELIKMLNSISKQCTFVSKNETKASVSTDNDKVVLYIGDTINLNCDCFIQIPKCGFLM